MNLSAHKSHKQIVIDRIKELGQIDIHGETVALTEIPPHLPYRLMGGATGTEAKTRSGKYSQLSEMSGIKLFVTTFAGHIAAAAARLDG